jgi:hypothetical protein
LIIQAQSDPTATANVGLATIGQWVDTMVTKIQ